MRPDQDLSWLARDCELRLAFHEAGYAVREVVAPATWLFDPMLGFVDDDGCVVFCDIGGQLQPGWDPESGHGSLWRLHRNDRLDAVVPPGHIGRGMVMFPTRAPLSFGGHGGETFFLGQLRPGRPGAHHTHAVYWVPPGSLWPEVFVAIPDSGTIGEGIAGALCLSGWGTDNTPEEGVLFVHSLMNCTIYAVTPDRRVEPWLVCDEDHGGTQFMPLSVFRAPPEWNHLAGQLIVSGRAGSSFGGAAASMQESPAYYRVDGDGPSRQVTRVDVSGLPEPETFQARIAPPTFGPLSGRRFLCRSGSGDGTNNASQMNTGVGTMPYDVQIVWLDDDNQPHLFADQLQTGAPRLIFQDDRMIVATVRMSYSTGQFHYPDGSLYEITYTG